MTENQRFSAIKILFLSVFLIFLVNTIGAVVVYGEWNDNNAQSIEIKSGDSVDFSAYFGTISPPMTVNIELYSGNNLIHSFENNTVVNKKSFAQIYTINQNIYSGAGDFQVKIKGSDKFGEMSGVLYLKVINNPPEIISVPITEVDENKFYSYQVVAADSDNDVLTYSLLVAPEWLSINSDSGLITGTAPEVNADTDFGVNVVVSDGKCGFATQFYVLSVNNIIKPNNPPVAYSQSVEIEFETPINIIFGATDPNNDALTFSIVSNPSNGVLSNFDTSTGQVTYTPNNGFSGGDLFTFKANDGMYNSNTATVSITVKPEVVNNAPEITSTPVTKVDEKKFYSYQVVAVDEDGDLLTYSLIEAPGWLSINSNTGLVTGTAPLVDADTGFNIKIRVSDGKCGSANQTYVLTVKDIHVPNKSPEITSTPVTKVDEKKFYSYQVVAVDLDNDTLIYSLSTAPSWISINANTGLISGTAPEVNADTNFGINVVVSDGIDIDTQSYVLSVENVDGNGGKPPTKKISDGEVIEYPYDGFYEQKYFNQFEPKSTITLEEETPALGKPGNILKKIAVWLLILILIILILLVLILLLRKS